MSTQHTFSFSELHHMMGPSSRSFFILIFAALLAEEVCSWPNENITRAVDQPITTSNQAENSFLTAPAITDEQWLNETNTNGTLGANVTSFAYIDFHRLGFNIFVRKLTEALHILNYFLKLDPMLVKVTESYTFTNNTTKGYNNTKNFTSEPIDGYLNYFNDSHVETTTESPLKNNPTEIPLETEMTPKAQQKTEEAEKLKVHSESQPPPKENTTENELHPELQDDMEKTPKKEEGFFSSVANKVTSIFKSFTNWF
uniref:Uncharacterized protein n=1 Tax=Graphocephala atropunctata TaxID=36148 RepID=A0A1B6MKF4_9HEMI